TGALPGEEARGVLLGSVTDPGTVRRARARVDEGREGSGRPGRAVVTAYTEVDPAQPAGAMREQVAERVAELAGAGADSVILQGTQEHPDPRPLIEALGHRARSA
ncbi:MAG TPA: hypothetical protein PLP61_13180, partial [Nocardioides sp.]|uniref:hypothetical protein n=1 Tax=Nocardioides sp. TaxID=35761 RepID=UPI002D010438